MDYMSNMNQSFDKPEKQIEIKENTVIANMSEPIKLIMRFGFIGIISYLFILIEIAVTSPSR